jgi:hypothetical protein
MATEIITRQNCNPSELVWGFFDPKKGMKKMSTIVEEKKYSDRDLYQEVTKEMCAIADRFPDSFIYDLAIEMFAIGQNEIEDGNTAEGVDAISTHYFLTGELLARSGINDDIPTYERGADRVRSELSHHIAEAITKIYNRGYRIQIDQ